MQRASQDHPDDCDPQTRTKHHPQDGSRAGAERHANADPFVRRLTTNAITAYRPTTASASPHQPHRPNHLRNGSRRQQPFVFEDLVHRAQVEDRQIARRPSDFLPDGGVSLAWMNVELPF